MSDPLYRQDLLRLAADAYGAGRLAAPDATGVAINPACGDRVTVDLRLAGIRLAEIAHDTKACVLAQASASILARSLKGTLRANVEDLHAQLRAMLEQAASVPAPPFDAYAVFQGAVEYTSRHRCVLLPVEAVLDALAATNPDSVR